MEPNEARSSDRDRASSPGQHIQVIGVTDGAVNQATAIGLQDNRQSVSGVLVQVNVTQRGMTTTTKNTKTDQIETRTGEYPEFEQKCPHCDLSSKEYFHNCPNCQQSKIIEQMHEIKCPGKKKPCGALLTIKKKFCSHCGWEIDKSMFNSERRLCKGKKEDGSECNADIQEGSRYCTRCGNKTQEESSSVFYICSAKTQEGVCNHTSKDSFHICPKCNSTSKATGLRREVKCPGEKHPCGSKLSIEDDFCPQCGWKVNKKLFFARSKCTNLKEDGSACLADIMDEDDFCSECGFPVSKAMDSGRLLPIITGYDCEDNIPYLSKTNE